MDRYRAYQQALERISVNGDDNAFSVEDRADALKAILLQEVAGLKARDEDQIELISSMIGMPPSETKKCLRSLSEAKIIAWNLDGRKSYSLWASSLDPFKVEQILERKVKNVTIAHKDRYVSMIWDNCFERFSVDWLSICRWKALLSELEGCG